MTLRATDPNDDELFGLIAGSFARLVGIPLIGKSFATDDRAARWLYDDAPFVVLAHDTGPDPRFIYANRAAQNCFGYSRDEMIGMPSRLSAEAPERAERQRLLDAVARDGFISDYKGVRISKSGRRFWIEKAVVWQLIDGEGRLHGQAATFSDWKDV